MSIFNKLTVRSLKLNKKRTIGTIIGIMLSTALICAVAGMATSLQKSMVATTIKDTGYYHLKLSNVTDEDVEKFKTNRDVKDVNSVNDIGYSYFEGSTNNNRPYIHLYSMDETSFYNMCLELLEGRYPTNSNEIAINEDILENSSKEYKIGDKITLNLGDRYAGGEYIKSGREYMPYESKYNPDGTPKATEEELQVNLSQEFEIVGIISNNDLPIRDVEYLTDAGYACITNGLEAGEKDIYIALENPSNCVEDIKEMIGIDLKSDEINETEYNYSINYELLRWEALQMSDSNAEMVMAVIVVAIIIIMITSIYCIKNAFSISLTEKIKMYGMLSSVGATKKQIKKSVIQEGMILSLVGIPLGIIGGILAVYILVILVQNILNGIVEAEIVFSISIIPIIVAALLGLITVYLSCLSAARKARKITPLEAIRSSNEVKIDSKKIKSPKFIKKVFGMGGVIAYKNLKRSKKKYRTTVVSIAISVFVFIAVSTLITYLFEAMAGYYEEYDYNIRVTSASNDGQDLLDIVQNEHIDDYTLIYNTVKDNEVEWFDVTDENIYSDFAQNEIGLKTRQIGNLGIAIKGLNSQNFKEFVEGLNLNYEDVKDKAILNDYYNLYELDGSVKIGRIYNYSKGDNISGKLADNELTLEIAEITNEIPSGLESVSYGMGLIIINIDEYKDRIDFAPIYLAINTDEPAELTEYLTENYHDAYIFNIDEQVKFYNAVKLLTSIFAYGFITVITLIGITNIFNTLTSNIELRQKEFAMLKSIGMTKKEFNRMVNLETIFYSFKALLYGIVLGLIASFAIYKAFAKGIDLGFMWPVQAILISVVFVFVIVFIIMRFAISKVNKQNIIETIRKENV